MNFDNAVTGRTEVEDEVDSDYPQAMLSDQSMLACSFHRGAGSLFAVAHNTVLVGDYSVRCEGVTFLPPGGSWLWLALLCAGRW